MRVTDDTRFPHPVLSHWSDDFTSGQFNVDFVVTEFPGTGSLRIEHAIDLTEKSLRSLVESGTANVGAIVRCGDTYYCDLHKLSWPTGQTDFEAGTLLNRVAIRPIVWLDQALAGWTTPTIHPEFAPPIDLSRGDIVAVDEEVIISVGKAKLSPIESIFELDRVPELSEGQIEVVLENDKISIRSGSETFELINKLRAQRSTRSVVMTSIFTPAIMSILDSLREGSEQYQTRRWYIPFMAKCESIGINCDQPAILEDAQRLLNGPLSGLQILLSDDHR